ASGAVGGLFEAEFLDQFAEAAAILGNVDGFDAGADDRRAGRLQGPRQVERRLAPKLHDQALGLDAVANVEYVLGRQGLEKRHVACVIVRRYRFRVRIAHDGFKTRLAQGKGGLATTIVKFDPLADAIGPAAEDHDAVLAGRRARLIL